MKKVVLVLVCLMSFVTMFFGENVVRIGNVLPLTGSAAPVGIEGKEARDMAVEEINAAGGIKSMGGAKIVMKLVWQKRRS